VNDSRSLVCLLAAIVVGCGSGSGAASTSAAPPAPADSAPAPQSLVFASTAERLWAALPKAYNAVGITVNGIDSVSHTIGFAGIIRQKLGGVRLSKYFRCGSQMGENADSYDIILYMASQMGRDPQSGHVLVKTSLRVSARSPAFASTKTMCVTTGELERRLNAAITTEVQR